MGVGGNQSMIHSARRGGKLSGRVLAVNHTGRLLPGRPFLRTGENDCYIYLYLLRPHCRFNQRGTHAMNRWDERSEDFRRARLELIKALHRKSLLDREDAEFAAPKPLLPAERDAAWDAPPRSR
jgi:hypothetical protein